MSAPPGEDRLDRGHLRELLRLYTRLAVRGTAVRMMGGRKGGPARVLVTALAMQVLVGLCFGAFAFAKLDVFTYSLLVSAGTFFMVGLSLVSEAGDVLFNRAEADVLGHRPIPSRTLLLAKSLSLLAFALMLALAQNVFPCLFGLAAAGARWWFPLVHLVSVVLLTITCAALVVLVHGVLTRLVSREKIDNWTTWAQVVMSIVFVVGYQLVPRLAERFGGKSLAHVAHWLAWLPPAWYGGLDAVAAGGQARPVFVALALLGLVVPVLLAGAALGRLAGSHAEAASQLLERPRKEASPVPRAPSRDWTRIGPLSRWLRDPVERAGFRLAVAYMARDREIRMRLYPQLTMMVVFPLLAILAGSRSAQATTMAAMSFALVAFLPAMAVEILASSSQHQAAGVFLTAPMASAGPLFHGVRKAAFLFLAAPATVVVAALVAFAMPSPWESAQLVSLVAPLMPAFSMLPAFGEDYLPLSRPPMRAQASRNVAMTLLMFLGVTVVVILGRLAISRGLYVPMLALEAALGGAAYALMRRRIDRRPLRAQD